MSSSLSPSVAGQAMKMSLFQYIVPLAAKLHNFIIGLSLRCIFSLLYCSQACRRSALLLYALYSTHLTRNDVTPHLVGQLSDIQHAG